jgi:uncharacterized membrane protein YphA (DoxX/SURF4 family)
MASRTRGQLAAQAEVAGEIEQEQPGALRSLCGFLSGPYPTLVSRLGLGLIFLLSGLTKLGVPGAFQVTIESYEMSLPPELVRIMAVGLPPLELGLGAWLLLGLFTRFAAGISGGLIVIFLVAMIQAMFRGLDPNCGCFMGAQSNPIGDAAIRALGPVGTWLANEKVGPESITRDVVFLLMSIHLLFVPTIWGLDNLRKRRQEQEAEVEDQEEGYDDTDESLVPDPRSPVPGENP